MQLERWLFRANLASTLPIRRDPALVRVSGRLPAPLRISLRDYTSGTSTIMMSRLPMKVDHMHSCQSWSTPFPKIISTDRNSNRILPCQLRSGALFNAVRTAETMQGTNTLPTHSRPNTKRGQIPRAVASCFVCMLAILAAYASPDIGSMHPASCFPDARQSH